MQTLWQDLRYGARMLLKQPVFPLIVVLALVLSVDASTASKSQGASALAELSRLETVWNEAHLKGDEAALDRLWADDLTVTVPSMPIMTKTEALEFVRSGRMRFQRYQTSGVRIRVYEKAAVVTGRLQRTRTINGQEVADDWQFTKLYIRKGKQWQVVAWHASPTSLQ